MNKRGIIKRSAQGFIDDILNEMRKQGYPNDIQIAILNQIKNILK